MDGQLRFDGRVVIVTGAARGIGRSYATTLAARGASVVVNDLGTSDGERLVDDVVDEIVDGGGQAVASDHDVAMAESAAAIVDAAVAAFGRVDAVINNAGIVGAGAFATQSTDEVLDVIGVSLLGSFHVTRAAWPHLVASGHGRVVMTTSAVGLWGGDGTTAYGAAKAGLVGLARGLAVEGEPHGVRVNCIAPAAQTRLTSAGFPRAGSRTWRPELVTPAVAYLAHDDCRWSGEIVAAVAGTYARVQVVQGAGHRFDPRGDVSPEDVVAHLDEIADTTGARPFVRGDRDALGLSPPATS